MWYSREYFRGTQVSANRGRLDTRGTGKHFVLWTHYKWNFRMLHPLTFTFRQIENKGSLEWPQLIQDNICKWKKLFYCRNKNKTTLEQKIWVEYYRQHPKELLPRNDCTKSNGSDWQWPNSYTRLTYDEELEPIEYWPPQNWTASHQWIFSSVKLKGINDQTFDGWEPIQQPIWT